MNKSYNGKPDKERAKFKPVRSRECKKKELISLN